jgi:N6-adenosine-specific RNA methylase IME4
VKFGTIIADPPWAYERTSGDKRLRGYSDQHYDPLSTADLAGLRVKDIVADQAVLFLWANGPFLADGSAQKIVTAWGFTPVTLMYWHKLTSTGLTLFGNVSHLGGVGYWFRGNCEPILVGKRGRSYRWSDMPNWTVDDTSALFEAPKGKHSAKPEVLHQRVERSAYPGPYLEMFGRRPRAGWTVVGNNGDHGSLPLAEDIRDAIDRLEKE